MDKEIVGGLRTWSSREYVLCYQIY